MLSHDENRERLLAMRDKYTLRVEAIQKDTHHKDEPVEKDFAEQATQSENDDVLSALDTETQATITQINAALSRIEQGTYGECYTCGQQIPEQRLLVVPYAEYCIECAEKASK